MINYKLTDNVLYTDTDSIFNNKPLPNNFIGKDLGLMIDEMEGILIKEGYFLNIKKYGYWYKDKFGNRIENSVFAGIERKSLSFK